jgi:hypothetical protein
VESPITTTWTSGSGLPTGWIFGTGDSVPTSTADGTTGSSTFCDGTGYGYTGQSGTLTFEPGSPPKPSGCRC